MELLRADQVQLTSRDAVYRQSRVTMVLVPLILLGGAAAMSWGIVGGSLPTFLWVGVGLLTAVTGLILPASAATFRRSNWLVCVQDERLLIKFRSYINHHLDAQAPVVVALSWSEVSSVRRRVQQMSRPDRGSSAGEAWNETSVEFGLRRSVDLGPLEDALAEERRRPAPKQNGVSMKATHYPVIVPEAGGIRVTWRGRRDRIVPAIDDFFRGLPPSVTVQEPVTVDRRHEQLEGDALDSLVLELVETGQGMAAASILRERYGYSLTDARRFITELLDGNSGAEIPTRPANVPDAPTDVFGTP